MARPSGSKDTKKRKPKRAYKSEALVGTKIGRWLVISIASGGKNVTFNLKCDCGTEAIRQYSTICGGPNGRSISCGCYHREFVSKSQIKPNNIAAKLKLFRNYQAGAKARNLSWNLNLEDFLLTTRKNCFYCEKEPLQIIKTVGGSIFYNGIDRVDNAKGYNMDNCVSCCEECNYKKRACSKEIIIKAYNYLKETGNV